MAKKIESVESLIKRGPPTPDEVYDLLGDAITFMNSTSKSGIGLRFGKVLKTFTREETIERMVKMMFRIHPERFTVEKKDSCATSKSKSTASPAPAKATSRSRSGSKASESARKPASDSPTPSTRRAPRSRK